MMHPHRDDTGESEAETSTDHGEEEEEDCKKDYINNETIVKVER